tara:strand:+ start:838 stop:1116 length:279 start_codon:yes stop_codon:yes gene_type:complete
MIYTIIYKLQLIFEQLAAVLRQDYLLHFLFGMVIAVPIIITMSSLTAFFIMVFVAIIKEIAWSYVYKSPASIQDVLFTITPVLLLILVKEMA